MKQLLYSSGSYIIGGWGSLALAGSLNSDRVFELESPSSLPVSSDGAALVVQSDTSARPSHSNDIQAVSILRQTKNQEIWCAVARSDKTLSLYRVEDASTDSAEPLANEPQVTQVPPQTIYKTPKRVTSLCFANVSDEYDSSYDLTVVIAADLAGDATAFVLTPTPSEKSSANAMKGRSRLLLGHTASMLTCVRIFQDGTRQRIATSDRDEKIRISSFPDTHIIQGFLLGHEAFVSCIDAGQNDGVTRCVSCSGDGTVRMWDYVSMEELGRHTILMDGRSPVPTQVAMNARGDTVVVCLDGYDGVQILRWKEEERRFEPLPDVASISGVVLAEVYIDNDDIFLTLTQGQGYVQAFGMSDKDGIKKRDYPLLRTMRSLLVDGDVHLPNSILERDDHGVLKMQKQEENRVHDRPWNDASRKTIAKERDRRNKKRRRYKKDPVASAADDGYDDEVE